MNDFLSKTDSLNSFIYELILSYKLPKSYKKSIDPVFTEFCNAYLSFAEKRDERVERFLNSKDKRYIIEIMDASSTLVDEALRSCCYFDHVAINASL